MKHASFIWLSVIALITFLALFQIRSSHSEEAASRAVIWSGNSIQEYIDLSEVQDPYTITLYTPEGGYNVVEVRPNEIAIIEANCRDQYCVRQGTGRGKGQPLVCLPHQLVIQMEQGPDGTSRNESQPRKEPDAVSS